MDDPCIKKKKKDYYSQKQCGQMCNVLTFCLVIQFKKIPSFDGEK